MAQEFYVDRREIRETLRTIWGVLGLIIAGNTLLWLNVNLQEGRLVSLCVTFFLLTLILLMVPELFALRYCRITFHEKAISVAY